MLNRARYTVPVLLVALAASPALASFGGGGSSGGGSMPEPSSSAPASSSVSSSREQAEKLYSQAYEEIGRAKKDEADGKKNVDKRYKKALDWGEQAVALDASYHEAWNLVGYAARKSGDYDKAFAAYDKCLAIKFDYAPAREYLGEAWLEKGDATKAREQLTLLEKFGAIDDAKTLRTAIEAYEGAHPVAATTDTTTTH